MATRASVAMGCSLTDLSTALLRFASHLMHARADVAAFLRHAAGGALGSIRHVFDVIRRPVRRAFEGFRGFFLECVALWAALCPRSTPAACRSLRCMENARGRPWFTASRARVNKRPRAGCRPRPDAAGDGCAAVRTMAAWAGAKDVAAGYRTAGRIVWSSWLPTSLPQLWTPAPAVSHDEQRLACPDADGMQMRRELEMDELTIDRDAMGRLARALAFICGADHPTTVALKAAAETGAERDIKNARALFLRLKQSDRRAALAMLDT
jgi:hypothetical protein